MLIDLLLRRLDLFQQLLEQGVVEIGELLDQTGARGALLIPKAVGQRDQIRGLPRPVAVGPLADQIDIAGNLRIGSAQRNLAQHQRPLRHRLQGGEEIAHPRVGGVHLVDENHMRDLVPVEKPQ